MRGPNRRSPFPDHIRIAGTGLPLGLGEGQVSLVAKKTISLAAVSPSDYKYGSGNPRVGRNQPYEKLLLGYGLDQQELDDDHRYRDALGVDASVWPWCLGPSIGTITPATTDATNGIQGGFTIAGVEFALAGRYLLKRVSDVSWTVAQDLGSGKAAVNRPVLFNSAATGTTLAFIPMGDSEFFWSFDGTTATQHASLYARAFLQVGREFYRAHDTNMMAKVDTNAAPLTAGNWGNNNAFRIGDKSSVITGLAQTATGVPIVFKTDGIYSLNQAGEDIAYFPFLKAAPDAENGLYHFAFENSVHATYREGHFRLSPDFTYEPIGPEKQLTSYTGSVKGRVTAGIGHGTFAAYAWVYNVDTDTSYLLKYGAWDGDTRIDRWHGSISAAVSGKVTAMWRSTVGASAGHQRAYYGTAAGTLGWLQLPCTPHPSNCDEYGFKLSGTITVSRFTGGNLVDPKTLRALTVTGPLLNASNTVTIGYKTDPATVSYTDFGNTFDGTVEKANFPVNTSATIAELQATLTAAASTASPLVAGIGLNNAWRDDLVQEYAANVLAENGLLKRNGTPYRIGATEIRRVVLAAAQAQGSVSVDLPDEQTKELSFIDYQETMALDDRRQWRAALAFTAVEFISQQTYGTYGRMEPYTYGQLESYSYGQLEAL